MPQESRTPKTSLVAQASPHNNKSNSEDLDSEPNDHSHDNFNNHYYKIYDFSGLCPLFKPCFKSKDRDESSYCSPELPFWFKI